MTNQLTRRASLAAILLIALTPALFAAKASETRLRSTLAGGAITGMTPSGHADYRSIPAQGRMRLNVEVESVNLPAGTVLDVFIDDAKIGSITIGPAPIRGGELELNSQDGQVVPTVKPGAVVVVRSATTAILSGVLN